MTTGKPSPASDPRPPDLWPDLSEESAPPSPAADRLRSAGGLVVAAVGIVMACLFTVALDGIRGFSPRPDAAALFYRTIGLSELALTPAGRQGRRPDPLPLSIDGRYLPLLPQEDPGVLPLLKAGQLTASRTTTP